MRHLPGGVGNGITQAEHREREQSRTGSETRLEWQALREARKDNKSGCALIVAPWVTGSVKGWHMDT